MRRSAIARYSNTFAAACVILLAACIAYGLLWQNAPIKGGDTPSYLEVAQSFEAGYFFKPFLRTPGYPLLLWLCGLPPSKTIVWTGLVLHAVSTLIGLWLLTLAGVSIISRLVFVFLMCLPLYVQSAGILLTENLAEFSLFATFFLWFESQRKSSVLLGTSAGLMAAWCAVVRPAYQLLPVMLFLVSFTMPLGKRPLPRGAGGRAWLVSSSTLAGIVLLLVVMTVNHIKYGYFALTPIPAWNFSSRTALFVERADTAWEPLRTALIEARNKALIRGQSHTALQYQWDYWPELKTVTGLDDFGLARQLMRLNVELVLQNPLEYLSAVARSWASSFFPYVTRLAGDHGILQILWSGLHFVIILLWLLQIWIYGGSAIANSLLGEGRLIAPLSPHAGETSSYELRRWIYWSTVLFVVYTVLVNSLIDVGDPRQRSPIDGFILMGCVIGCEALIVARRGRGFLAH